MFQPHQARRGLLIAIAVLCVLAFVPSRWTWWAGDLGRLVQFFAAPISQPFAAASRWAAPATRHRDEAEVAGLKDELEATRSKLMRVEAENGRLRDQIQELQRGIALNPDLPVQPVLAPVYGSSSDLSAGLLRVRAGTKQGVDVNSVATTSGLQLVGRVVSAGSRTCTVLPITSKAAGSLRAMVMVDQTSNGLACTLTPEGDGLLRGPVEDRRGPGSAPVEPRIGQSVRLADPDHWPSNSQMLLIGEVVSVEPAPSQPLRKIITVRPTVERLDRVSEVILRVTPTPPDEEEGGRRKGGGG